MIKLIAALLFLTSIQSTYAAKFYAKDNFLTYYSNHKITEANSKIDRLVKVRTNKTPFLK